MMSDGVLGKCKDCARLDVAENRRKRIAYYRKWDRERAQTASRKADAMEAQRRSREANPDKARARNAVANAVRDGRLIPQPCEVCGDLNAEAHHDDYLRPLSVQWLCFTHHRMHHGQFQELISLAERERY